MAKVLVIDDDQDFLDAVRMMFERAGFEVAVALTPTAGLEMVKTAAPDLVVLDVMMPADHEGFAVARAIREELNMPKLPLIILSAIHAREQAPYRFAADDTYLPVDLFLDKPVDTSRLLDAARQLLGERRIEPEHPL
jgi:CheY-like chemotaxis protein